MTDKRGCKYFISRIFLIIFFLSCFHLYFCGNANSQKLSRGIEYLNEGIESYENGRYEYAIISLNRALNELPEGDRENLWKVHFYLGLSYYLMGESKEAKKEFANAHEIIMHKMPDPEIYSPKIVKLFKDMATFAVARPGKAWRDPVTGMEFVWVPAGCFEMGSPEGWWFFLSGEAGRDSDEGPVHEVCVDGFWIGRYEVTRGQFRRFIETEGYETDADKQGFSWVWPGKWEKKEGYNWLKAGFTQDDNHPLVNVSWNDAKAMADWLSKKSDRHFRLPTEAEWEYAVRGGTKTARFWGDNSDEACRYANVADQTAKRNWSYWTIHNCDDGYAVTAPVGSFQPNPFGLYDMLGNIWEWCEDIYSKDAYRKHERNNPIYTASGSDRVIRGGSWDSGPRAVRCANRNFYSPGRRFYYLGFRLLRTR